MKNLKKITTFFQLPTDVKIPFQCKDGYIIKDKKELPFQLIIEKINETIGTKSANFYGEVIDAYTKLDKPDKVHFSFAMLHRYLYLKESGNYDFVSHYQYPDSIFNMVYFLSKADFDVFTDLLKIQNDIDEHLDAEHEEILLRILFNLSSKKSLPKKLLKEIEKRFQHYEKEKKVAEEKNYLFSEESHYKFCLRLLGKYDPAKEIQEKYDPNFAKGKIMKYFHDDFPKTKNALYAQEQEAVEVFLTKEINPDGPFKDYKTYPTVKEYLSKEREHQKNFFMALFQRMIWYQSLGSFSSEIYGVLNMFARRKIPFSEQELLIILRMFKADQLYHFTMVSFFKNIELHIKNNGLTKPMTTVLKEIVNVSKNTAYNDRDFTKIQTKAKETLAIHSSDEITTPPFFFDEQDHFGVMANEDLKNANPKTANKWFNLLNHAFTAKTGKPSAKWLTKAKPLVKAIGKKEFFQRLNSWLDFINTMEFTQQNEWYGYFFHQNNVPTIKGLMWSLSTLPNEELDQTLEKLIVRCFKKIPGVGPASGALGNACIYTVAKRNSLEGVALLNRAHSKISQRNTKALIQKYIAATAAELNISISDLKDFSIQDFGLENGIKEFVFNDYKARLTLPSFGKALLEWFKPDGKPQKSVPAFVRKDFADELKAIRNDAKLIPKTLTIQRDRLDRSYIQKRAFPYPHFEQYYFNHGLMSFLTKKLIWTFINGKKSTTAIWLNDQWQDVKGKKVTTINEKTKVQLWHPLHSSTKEILQWRNLLQEHQIKQPLKQAYREVYILTDAEINTKVYSNRMAAHILKQHQFNALAGIRGWKYKLMGWYDDGIESQTCSLQIPDYNLQAEFWINELNAEDQHNDTGIWNYVATDQIRFTHDEETVDLIDVPKIVFSEAMRDVDLFVGVGSVGNDPAWQDNGGLPQFNDYWQSYSFGDLTEVAKTRKTILEKLLPRLKIAKVASIQGKFLVVEGKVRTYKIHIGSTNILMEPNDQYLCIVPARGAGTKNDKLFIPFEGDRGFSILLSKAFMLAEDDKITDSTILTQIGSKQ